MEPLDLTKITLSRGPTPERSDTLCLPEAAAWFACEEHSDHPRCVSPVLVSAGTVLCERLPDGKRQRLKKFVPSLVHTAGDGRDDARARLALDWLVRDYTPAWLRLVPELELAAAWLAERRPVLTVADAVEILAVPRDVVARALYLLYGADIWQTLRPFGARLRDAVARELAHNAGETAIAGAMMLAEGVALLCNKVRILVEAALLIAACSDAVRDPLLPIRRLATGVVARAAGEVEDAAIELYARMTQLREPEDRDWIGHDIGHLLRRMPRPRLDS